MAAVNGTAGVFDEKGLAAAKKQLVILDKFIAYLEKPENKARLQGLLTNFAEGVLHKLDTQALSRQLEGKIKQPWLT